MRRLASRAASSSARAASRSRSRRLRQVISRTTRTAPTTRPSPSRTGAALAFTSSARPSNARTRTVRAERRDYLPAQRPADGEILEGERRTRGAAHIKEAGSLAGRQGFVPGWRTLHRVQVAVRPVHLREMALRIVHGDPIGHGIQDGAQLFGTLGRLYLTRLGARQRLFRLLAGILLGGVEAGTIDRQGDAVSGALQQLLHPPR